MKWKFYGTLPPEVKKCMVIVIPHTSWHDFYIGLLVRRILNVDIKFLAKKELFKPPFGWYFKWMGGTALDRTQGQKKVEAIAEIFNSRDEFRLAISPEGTRKKVTAWKTGFYYISLAAKVPIIMIAFNFGQKKVEVSQPFTPSGDIEKDFKIIRDFYKDVVGKVPQYT